MSTPLYVMAFIGILLTIHKLLTAAGKETAYFVVALVLALIVVANVGILPKVPGHDRDEASDKLSHENGQAAQSRPEQLATNAGARDPELTTIPSTTPPSVQDPQKDLGTAIAELVEAIPFTPIKANEPPKKWFPWLSH